jgi:thiol-disulfide isomerase/thioredoxin
VLEVQTRFPSLFERYLLHEGARVPVFRVHLVPHAPARYTLLTSPRAVVHVTNVGYNVHGHLHLSHVQRSHTSLFYSREERLLAEASGESGTSPQPRSRRLHNMITVVVVIAGLAALYLVFRPQDSRPEISAAGAVQGVEARVDSPAPDFTLTDLEGKPVSLSQYRGKVVLLDLWASWCGPCRAELPDLQEVYEMYKDEEFVLLAVNQGESRETVQKFLWANGYTFPIALDGEMKVGGMYRITGLPENYFIDRDGVIRVKRIGAMEKDVAEKTVQDLLGE